MRRRGGADRGCINPAARGPGSRPTLRTYRVYSMGYSTSTLLLVAGCVAVAAAWSFKDHICPWWPSWSAFDLPHPCPCFVRSCRKCEPDSSRQPDGPPYPGHPGLVAVASRQQQGQQAAAPALPVVFAEPQQSTVPVATAVPVTASHASRAP